MALETKFIEMGLSSTQAKRKHANPHQDSNPGPLPLGHLLQVGRRTLTSTGWTTRYPGHSRANNAELQTTISNQNNSLLRTRVSANSRLISRA